MYIWTEMDSNDQSHSHKLNSRWLATMIEDSV